MKTAKQDTAVRNIQCTQTARLCQCRIQKPRQKYKNQRYEKMFIRKTAERNPELVEAGFDLMKKGLILPDTYVIDTDRFLANAEKILQEARRQGIDLYFMLKQIGRNPWLAQKLVEMGYPGAVTVDFREAQVMMDHNIPICNVGHLVQCPRGFLKEIIAYGPEYMTVYSREKIREISREAASQGKVMKLLIKVADLGDLIYSGQSAGFSPDQLPSLLDEIDSLPGVMTGGVTSFPAFLLNDQSKELEATHNLETLMKAGEILAARGVTDININAPSATCVRTISAMSAYPAISSAEPGHGLSGTTPLHALEDEPEIPCVIYMTEVSHDFHGHSYCYGGGYYRRSCVKEALAGTSLADAEYCKVIPADPACIDYYFELDRTFPVSTPVCMAFRFQIFVTRSHTVLVQGLASGHPEIIGEYDSLGRKL